MEKFLTASLMALATSFSSFSLLSAAPDPRDSIIIESKTVEPAVGKPAARVRVYISNKDSLGGLTLSLVERSLYGSAYKTLAWPRTWDSIVTPLTNTLHGVKAFNGQRYQGTPPDTFVLFGTFSGDLATAEPPNLVRKPFWEIKFDTVRSNTGTVELDSAYFVWGWSHKYSTMLISRPGGKVPVNFVKGTITVEIPPPPCIAKRLDVMEDGSLNISDVVQLINCAFLGRGNAKRLLQQWM